MAHVGIKCPLEVSGEFNIPPTTDIIDLPLIAVSLRWPSVKLRN